MQDITVAAVAVRSEIGEIERNLANVRAWTLRARDEGAEFVVFPELSVSGFWLHRDVHTIAQPVPGPASDALVDIARDAGVILTAGVVEERRGLCYNAHVLVGPNGLFGIYRKTHINSYESPFFAEGNEHPVFDIGPARVGISICYDNRFPENLTALALGGAEVLVMPFAYGGSDHERWQNGPDAAAYRTRGYDTGSYVVAVNNAGPVTCPDGRTNDYPGGAFVSDPNGEIVARTEGTDSGEKMVTATLRAEVLHSCRTVPHYPLRLRRPEIYGSVCEMA